jgi:hypothetical protein
LNLNDPSVLLSILTLLSTIVGFIYTWFKDERDRKWRKEDEASKSRHLTTQDTALDNIRKQVDVVIKNGNATNGHDTP